MFQSKIIRYTVIYAVLLFRTQVFARILMDHIWYDNHNLFQGALRKKDLEKAHETKSQVLATFMCIVFDEHFKKAGTITGDLFATICTDTPTLFSASPFPVQPRLSILHLVIIRFTISRYISAVDGDKAWSTIFLFNSHFHFFHVLISCHSYALWERC